MDLENNDFPTISKLLKVVRNSKTSKARIMFKMNDGANSKKPSKPRNQRAEKKMDFSYIFNQNPSYIAAAASAPKSNLHLDLNLASTSKVTEYETFQNHEINVKKAGRKPNGFGYAVPDYCPDCEKHKDSIKNWRFDSEIQQYFCNTCFARRVRRQRMYVEEESGRMCVKCDRTRSNDWYRDKETSGDLCAACYMQSYHARSRTDRTCNGCTTNVTRQWYKDKREDGYICTQCYKRRLKTDK